MIVIKDDFYPNPDEVRKKALQLFYTPGIKERNIHFPGRRTLSTYSQENFIYCKNQWEHMLNTKMQYFPRKNSNTGFTLSYDRDTGSNWVHHDCSGYLEQTTKSVMGKAYAAVIYLSPNADVKKAYRKMVKKYHPDKLQGLGEEHLKGAKEKFQSIQSAYEKIKNERGL